MKLLRALIAGAAVVSWSMTSMAAEVSMGTAGFKSEKSKNNGEDAGGKKSFEVGLRYGDALDSTTGWFGEGQLAFKSYDAPSGGKAPDDSSTLSLFGGMRMYFLQYSQSVVPFVSGKAGYLNQSDADASGTETEVSGLFYGASAGLRLPISADLFFELETDLFESALFGTKKTKDAKGTKTETTSTDIAGDTTGGISDTTIALGMRI